MSREHISIIAAELLIARPITGGFSWTLASKLGQLLNKAEQEYGERDKRYTVLGVEFNDSVPKIWFPGARNDVVVQLGIDTIQNSIMAYFQLAHEVVHLLNPFPGPTNKLEEGVATDFQQRSVRDANDQEISTGDQKYDDARNLVKQLTQINANVIRSLRESYGALRNITASQIINKFPSVDRELANQLTEQFK